MKNSKTSKITFFVILFLITALTLTAFFGIENYYGDTRKVYFKGAEDIRWGIDIRGGVEAVFSPDKAGVDITDADMDSAKAIIETRLVNKNITDYEAAAFMEKYKGNYFAFRTLHEVLTKAGKNLDSYVMYPDRMAREIDQGEKMLLNWGREWKGSNYMGALLQNRTNPITALAEMVQKFTEGKFTAEDPE
jgi:preprotein translocase subunit SecD